MTASSEGIFSIGYAIPVSANESVDPEMLGRARAFTDKVKPNLSSDDKVVALLQAVSTFYPDVLHAWCAWDSLEDMRSHKAPAEQLLFDPADHETRGKWLCDCIDKRRSVQFLVPLSRYVVPNPAGQDDTVTRCESAAEFFGRFAS